MIPTAALFAGQSLWGVAPSHVAGVSRDSRMIRPGDAYVAIGRDDEQSAHLAQAEAAGATLALVERLPALRRETVPLLRTPHARWSFARASVAAHALDRLVQPLVAVTGTAGKSTTTHCAWWAMGEGAARVGTIGWHDGVSERPNPQTTPPPEELHGFLAGLPRTCPGVAMEISSHAGDQHRLAGLSLAALAFTGLGHDHLDYHRTVGAYLAAKLRIVRLLAPGGLCVINADDPNAHTVAHAVTANGARVLMLGFRHGVARIVGGGGDWRLRHEGLDYPLAMRLPGDFNAWNAAAGAFLASAVGVPLATALARLATLPAVPGRLELLAHGPDTYVDYAHTPEEIAVMLRAVRREFPGRRLVCVFGCGGDRDRSKRGPMGCAALEADLAVLTTDNSRSETPRAIADDVIGGLPQNTRVFWAAGDDVASGRWLGDIVPSVAVVSRAPQDGRRSLVVELDRANAIRLARALAGEHGVVVVAGKGHETSQIIVGRTLPWDDRAFVRDLQREQESM